MKIKLTLLSTLLVILFSVDCFAQNTYNEIGVSIGPVSFRGDWGDSGKTGTNLTNTGVALSVLHYASYAYGRNSYKYFNQHFKVRNQLTIHHTNLEHYGRWVEREGPPFRLANMSGATTVVEIGSGLEWNWKNIRDYERQQNTFQPYAGVGFNIVYFNTAVETSLPGEIGSPENTWPTFLPDGSGKEPILNSSEITAALNFQGGTRYRLNKEIDLFIEGRWHYYFSDFVDGLSPINPNNESNDWIFMLNVGFTYYLD